MHRFLFIFLLFIVLSYPSESSENILEECHLLAESRQSHYKAIHQKLKSNNESEEIKEIIRNYGNLFSSIVGTHLNTPQRIKYKLSTSQQDMTYWHIVSESFKELKNYYLSNDLLKEEKEVNFKNVVKPLLNEIGQYMYFSLLNYRDILGEISRQKHKPLSLESLVKEISEFGIEAIKTKDPLILTKVFLKDQSSNHDYHSDFPSLQLEYDDFFTTSKLYRLLLSLINEPVEVPLVEKLKDTSGLSKDLATAFKDKRVVYFRAVKQGLDKKDFDITLSSDKISTLVKDNITKLIGPCITTDKFLEKAPTKLNLQGSQCKNPSLKKGKKTSGDKENSQKILSSELKKKKSKSTNQQNSASAALPIQNNNQDQKEEDTQNIEIPQQQVKENINEELENDEKSEEESSVEEDKTEEFNLE